MTPLLEPEEAKKLQDDIASTEALLDQAQAHYHKHKHLWTEEYCLQDPVRYRCQAVALGAGQAPVQDVLSVVVNSRLIHGV